jgi:hypothetical protein
MGAKVCFFGIKDAERETEQSPPSCFEAKKEFHKATSLYAIMTRIQTASSYVCINSYA